ncbi:MAG: 3-phosphoshikimate 1-carboxyvinyltransferase [Bacteroidia bacterium]|nr:MAG: 3-phosphoshikimate 1-carboxyvinyltransferase [Bacteroidia bacterium]
MEVIIRASRIGGKVCAPASKSSMQRAVAAALLADGLSTLVNPSYSSDSLAAIGMAECLGATFTKGKGEVIIRGGFNPIRTSLNCNESGLGARLFCSIAALSDVKIGLTGTGSVMSRPMEEGFECLRLAGAKVKSNNGRLPVDIQGPLKGGTLSLDSSTSSQFLTGLLMVLPTLGSNSILNVINLASRQYIDLTIDVMSGFGVNIHNENYKRFMIPGNQSYRPATYNVEGDWSGAALMLVLGAIGGNLCVDNLYPGSSQPDRYIIPILRDSGAIVEKVENGYCAGNAVLNGFTADISGCPDLAPPLVALAAYCSGRTTINGTSRLSIKESDRGKTLESEFIKLGVQITNYGDHIVVEGGEPLTGGRVSSHGDHRIAMALAVAAVRASGEVIIEDAESVNKSYPGFFEDMSAAGANLKIIE